MQNLFNNLKTSILIFLVILIPACATQDYSENTFPGTTIISVLGINDVHGQLLPQPGRGGLALLSGYVDALRAVRTEDGGSVLLIDAGDMWQGTLESNVSEGANVLNAYNSIGFTAAAIGNHDFDFGPVGDSATPQSSLDDPRGALKQRAAEAKFPLLAANLVDVKTGKPVEWPNVQPSILINVNDVYVGIIGVMTIDALSATIAANTTGLRVDPLAKSIVREAQLLRSQGAALVIVSAHAGGNCESFNDPSDLTTCETTAEIFEVARKLSPGLVDHIIAGHKHNGIAHVVNGVAITSAYSSTRAFGRVDFSVDKASGVVRDLRVYPPQPLCPYVVDGTGECAWRNDENNVSATYEGLPIVPNAEVVAISKNAAGQAEKIKAAKIGIYLDTPFNLVDGSQSALGNLMTSALLESSGADIAIHNVVGGIRAGLPEGELTFGSVYQMFPFDNRLVIVNVSGRDLRRIIEQQAHNEKRRAGFAGMRVYINCSDGKMDIKMVMSNGQEIYDQDIIRIAVNDFLALGGDNILTPAMPSGGFVYPDDTPIARDALVDWLRKRGGRIQVDDFIDAGNPRWTVPKPMSANCRL